MTKVLNLEAINNSGTCLNLTTSGTIVSMDVGTNNES